MNVPREVVKEWYDTARDLWHDQGPGTLAERNMGWMIQDMGRYIRKYDAYRGQPDRLEKEIDR